MAVTNLVDKLRYPVELSKDLPGYDPAFAVRGLAVDVQTAWICHLTHTYRVSTAYFGREQVPKSSIQKSYSSVKGTG
eukprot:7320639-Prorocentrum_lima.AAC.1